MGSTFGNAFGLVFRSFGVALSLFWQAICDVFGFCFGWLNCCQKQYTVQGNVVSEEDFRIAQDLKQEVGAVSVPAIKAEKERREREQEALEREQARDKRNMILLIVGAVIASVVIASGICCVASS